MLEQLIEEAGNLYDCLGPPCGRRSAKLPARNHSLTFNYRRALYPRFSEIVLDKSDSALEMMNRHNLDVVELSALRLGELSPLVEAIPGLDLSGFHFVSIHAPSKFAPEEEASVLG